MYAHPDDESFGIAGTAMKLAAAAHTTALLTLTRGDVGMWFGKERGSWTPAELAAERSKEWREAVSVIGFKHARLLEWPDGGVATSPAERVTADVVQFIREIRPDVVCTFGPEGAGSEHDDHRAAFIPDLPFVAMTPTHTVDMREFQEREAQVFECHKTQFKDRDRFYQMLERRGGKEFFHLAIDRGAPVPDAGDLLA